MAQRLTFLEKSPDAVLKDIIAQWQSVSGRILYPSQVENLELHTLAYRESLLRQDIQRCAEQNLVGFAIGEHLDALGAMLGCPRLQPAAAECRVRFALAAPVPAGRTFPAGTRLTTPDGKLAFETAVDAYVVAWAGNGPAPPEYLLSSEVAARCVTVGAAGNGVGAGLLDTLDPVLPGVTGSNTTATGGGAELETDGDYRERLLLAPAGMGCGGSRNAYRYWARTASALVADAAAEKGEGPGDISIYVLSKEGDGRPGQTLLDAVREVCNSPDVRLINDQVQVFAAEPVEYRIEAEITVFDTHNAAAVHDRVTALAHDFAQRHRQRLGQDVTPTQLLMALSPVGEALYHVRLAAPSGILGVDDRRYALATDVAITLAGHVRG